MGVSGLGGVGCGFSWWVLVGCLAGTVWAQ